MFLTRPFIETSESTGLQAGKQMSSGWQPCT